MACKFFLALIDKQSAPIWPFWSCSVFGNIETDEVYGFGFEFYLSVTVALTKDGQGLILGVKIVQIKCCGLTGSGAGVIEKM